MFSDATALVLLVPILLGLLILIARIDLYLLKRRNQIAAARYMAEMDAFPGIGFRLLGAEGKTMRTRNLGANREGQLLK